MKIKYSESEKNWRKLTILILGFLRIHLGTSGVAKNFDRGEGDQNSLFEQQRKRYMKLSLTHKASLFNATGLSSRLVGLDTALKYSMIFLFFSCSILDQSFQPRSFVAFS